MNFFFYILAAFIFLAGLDLVWDDLRDLTGNVLAHYREFIQHPNFCGPKFNWSVPARLFWSNWKCTRRDKAEQQSLREYWARLVREHDQRRTK